ncbi:hypothetical protein B0H67DRAFT_471060, partial [Lasiosphaeris hirsuta]
PYCPSDTPFCVYTNSAIHRHGLSVVGIPATAAAALNETTSLPHVEILFDSSSPAADAAHAAREPAVAPYELRDLPGRGKGLVATRPVARGAVLMVDWAALLVDAEFPQRVRRDLGREMLMEAIGGLERGGREVVLGLARSSSDPGGVPAAEDVVKTNSFSVNLGGRSFMALFPRISRMNHACKPSASTRFDMQTLSSTVTAFRDMQPGEEITISYSDWGLTYPERQRVLKQKWGFDCTCSLCSSSAKEIAESDARREAISRLGKEVLAQVEEQNYKEAIKLNREMLVALEDEALVPHMGDYYEVMARLYGALPDIDNAKKFAKLALEEFRAFGTG